MERSPINFKRLSLTDLKIDIKRVPKKKDLVKALEAADVQNKWAKSSWGRKLIVKKTRAALNDIDRFKIMLAKIKLLRTLCLCLTWRHTCQYSLKGHTKTIDSVSWDPSGELLASVSEDSVRIWTLGTGNEGECVHELSCNGSKFHSCVFHPTYPSLLVIGCYQSMELWNMAENKTMTLSAHDCLITALAVSTLNGLVASASHDKFIKLWKKNLDADTWK